MTPHQDGDPSDVSRPTRPKRKNLLRFANKLLRTLWLVDIKETSNSGSTLYEIASLTENE